MEYARLEDEDSSFLRKIWTFFMSEQLGYENRGLLMDE